MLAGSCSGFFGCGRDNTSRMHMYIAMTRRGQPPKRIPKRSLCHSLLRLYLQSLANTVVTHVFNKKVTVRREWFEELGVRQLRNDAPQWAPTASRPQRRRLVRHTRRMRDCRRGHCKGNITKPLLVLDYTALNHMCWYFHAPKVAKKRALVRKEAYGKYDKRHWWCLDVPRSPKPARREYTRPKHQAKHMSVEQPP